MSILKSPTKTKLENGEMSIDSRRVDKAVSMPEDELGGLLLWSY